MCGRPAVPRTSARPRDRKSIWLVVVAPYFRPGWRNASPLPLLSAAAPSSVLRLKSNFGQHQHRDQDGAADQQHGLDDLHPGGALHAADGDVEDHQGAHQDDGQPLGRVALDAQQQRDERAGADHLREQVEDRDHDRGRGRRRADRTLLHPERELVGHREAAGVAQQLRDQQEREQPGHQEADGVEEAVVAGQGDQPGDAEERRGAHVVAGDGEAVLEAAERATAGVVVGRRLVLPAGPEGDRDGDADDHDEEDRGQGLGAHRPAPPLLSLLKRSSTSRASWSTLRFMYLE